MSAMQYYLNLKGRLVWFALIFLEREAKIMEVTGIALQTVAAGEDVAFTETAVNGTKCIVHRQGSGIIKLRGITNQCKARFLVSYSGNIQIPTGGTVGEISLAIAVDGEPLQSTKMIVTPAAVENLFNVSSQAYVDVPCGCCSTVAVQNTSTQAIEVQNSNRGLILCINLRNRLWIA